MARENFTARATGDFFGSSGTEIFPRVQKRSHGPEINQCPDSVTRALPSRGSEVGA